MSNMNDSSCLNAMKQYVEHPTNSNFSVLETIPKEVRVREFVNNNAINTQIELPGEVVVELVKSFPKRNSNALKDKFTDQSNLLSETAEKAKKSFNDNQLVVQPQMRPQVRTQPRQSIGQVTQNVGEHPQIIAVPLPKFPGKGVFTEFFFARRKNGKLYFGVKFIPNNQDVRKQFKDFGIPINKNPMKTGVYDTKNLGEQLSLLDLAKESGAISNEQYRRSKDLIRREGIPHRLPIIVF